MKFSIFWILLITTVVGLFVYRHQLIQRIDSAEADTQSLEALNAKLPPNLERTVEMLETAEKLGDPYLDFRASLKDEFGKELESRVLPDNFTSESIWVSSFSDVRKADHLSNFLYDCKFQIYVPKATSAFLEANRWHTFSPAQIKALPQPLDQLIPIPKPIRTKLKPGLNEFVALGKDESLSITLNGKLVIKIDCPAFKGFGMPNYQVAFRWMAHQFPSWNKRRFDPTDLNQVLGTYFWRPAEPSHNLNRELIQYLGIQYRIVTEDSNPAEGEANGNGQ